VDTLKQMLDDLKGKRVKHYTILTYPLDIARANEPLFIAGSYIYVLNLDGTAKIRLNEISRDDIDLFKYRQIASPFYRIFLTHTAQATKVLSFAVGVSSETFSISDYGSPDVALMSGYIQQLRDSQAYNYGNQISKSSYVQGIATVLMHTVSAGKTFLLEYYQVNGSATNGGTSNFFVANAVDASQYEIDGHTFTITNESYSGHAGTLVLAIPEGWKIKISAETVGCHIKVFIKGREI